MDDLKLYAKSERELDQLIQTVRTFSDDVSMGVLQLDSIMNRVMKEKVKSKYNRRVKKILRSQSNGRNVIAGMNVQSVGIIRYGAGVLDQRKEELKSTDIKTMKGSLHPRGTVGRLQEKGEEEGL